MVYISLSLQHNLWLLYVLVLLNVMIMFVVGEFVIIYHLQKKLPEFWLGISICDECVLFEVFLKNLPF